MFKWLFRRPENSFLQHAYPKLQRVDLSQIARLEPGDTSLLKKYKRTELDSNPDSDLDFSLELIERLGRRILLIAVKGVYRPGSQGEPDARFVAELVARFGIRHYPVDAMILDFRELTYTWGNDFEDWINAPFRFWEQEWAADAIIVGENCAYAIGTLGNGDPLSLSDPFCYNESQALRLAENAIAEQKAWMERELAQRKKRK